MAWLVLVNGREVDAGDIEYTNSDPGGCETATIQLTSGPTCRPGDRVQIFDGLTPVWDGYAEEPGQRLQRQAGGGVIAAVGAGVVLKRNPYPEIYIDRDLTQWAGPPLGRRVALGTASQDVVDPSLAGGAAPAIRTAIQGAWSRIQQCEAWYDAGPEVTIGVLIVGWARIPGTDQADANWDWQPFITVDEAISGIDASGNLRAAGPSTASVTATASNRRYGVMRIIYGAAAGANGQIYGIDWNGVAVVGRHGLGFTLDAGGLSALKPSDVVTDALSRSGAALDAAITDSGTTVLMPHLVSKTPQTPEAWIATCATFLGGWHYGVWPGPLRPVFVFSSPAGTPTARVDYRDLGEPDLTERLSAIHNRARIRWRMADNIEQTTTVDIAHPRMPAGVTQELEIDAGLVGSSAAATAIGTLLLQLDQADSRVAGSVQLPTELADGSRAAHLQPGRERLQVLGIPSLNSLLGPNTTRADTFRLKRVSVSVRRGVPTVSAELDAGANLTETVQARLAVAAQIAG